MPVWERGLHLSFVLSVAAPAAESKGARPVRSRNGRALEPM
jgi:hypothetical protein